MAIVVSTSYDADRTMAVALRQEGLEIRAPPSLHVWSSVSARDRPPEDLRALRGKRGEALTTIYLLGTPFKIDYTDEARHECVNNK